MQRSQIIWSLLVLMLVTISTRHSLPANSNEGKATNLWRKTPLFVIPQSRRVFLVRHYASFLRNASASEIVPRWNTRLLLLSLARSMVLTPRSILIHRHSLVQFIGHDVQTNHGQTETPSAGPTVSGMGVGWDPSVTDAPWL